MKYFLCLLMIVSAKFSLAQNLVPNPSFEDTVYCPPNGRMSACKYWNNCRGTPDYNNACAQLSSFNGFSVPSNMLGYQLPATGNAYCDLHCWGSSPLFREYIGAALLEPLTVGQLYYVSLKCVSINMHWYNRSINNIGIRFSTVSYDSAHPAPIDNLSHVYSSDIITDSVNWTIISASWVADSAYTFLMIGNFFDDAHTQTEPLDSGYSVYYIDDVCVSTDSLECDLNTSSNHQPVQTNFSIYPNPSHQVVNITLPQGSTQIEIFNAIGQSVYKSKVTSLHQVVDVSKFSDGVYFARVQSHQVVQTEKFVVQH